MIKETSELEEILETLLENFNHPPELYRYLEAQAFNEATQAIQDLVREARISELLGLKYALNVDKDAYMHLILDIRIKTIEGQKQ